MKASYLTKRLRAKDEERVYKVCVESAVKSAVAGFLYTRIRKGWHKDRLKALWNDILALYQCPPVFGKYLDDTDVIKYVSEYIGLTDEDWSELQNSIKIEVI